MAPLILKTPDVSEQTYLPWQKSIAVYAPMALPNADLLPRAQIELAPALIANLNRQPFSTHHKPAIAADRKIKLGKTAVTNGGQVCSKPICANTLFSK